MDKDRKDLPASRRILDTAFALLSSKGYAAVGMREIADGAGVALSQLTYYYRSKEGLMRAVIDDTGDRYLEEIERELLSRATPAERLSALSGFFESSQPFLRIVTDFTAQSLWVPAFKRQINAFFEKLTRLTERTVFPPGWEPGGRLTGFSRREAVRLMLAAFYGTSVQSVLAAPGPEAVGAMDFAQQLFSLVGRFEEEKR